MRALGNNLVFAFVPGITHQFCYLHTVTVSVLFQVVSGASATSAGAADAALAAAADATQTKLDSHLPEMKYTLCNLCPSTELHPIAAVSNPARAGARRINQNFDIEGI